MDGALSPLRFPFEAPPDEGTAIEVAPGILWVRLPLPMVLDHVNIFVLDDGDSWTVVDTGMASKRSKAIWERVLAGPLAGKPVGRLLVTHHHPDHIGLAGWFQNAHGADLMTTRTAWLMARMLTLDEQAVPDTKTLAFWRSAGMDPAVLAKRQAERPMNFADIVEPLPLGYRRIKEGDSIEIGGRLWDVRMGFGHAPEHATLWSRDGALVLGGDQLLASISPILGVYASEPEADPVEEWLESCERLRPFARDSQLVLPGHKLPFTGLPMRMSQLIGNHHEALDRLEDFLVQPRVAPECFSVLFRSRITESNYGMALVEAMAHLNHLLFLGRITRTRREDGAWLWQEGGA